MIFWIGFICGMFFASFMGALVMGMCIVAGKSDEAAGYKAYDETV